MAKVVVANRHRRYRAADTETFGERTFAERKEEAVTSKRLRRRQAVIRNHSSLRLFVAVLLVLLLPVRLTAEGLRVPAGTAVYGELDEQVTSRKKDTSVGDIVRAHVWRNVLVDGRIVIEAGAPIVTRVSMVKPAKIAGRKGDVHLEAISVRGIDGGEILLDGGYDKSGKGRKALAWSLFALVAWPLVFIKGKHSILEPGTVFDMAIQADVDVLVEESRRFAIRLGEPEPAIGVEILYDEMDPDEKQKILPLRISHCEDAIESASVVTVNESEITPIPVVLGGSVQMEGCTKTSATVDLEALAKHFTKGINRFEIETPQGSTEVILEIEI